LSRFRPHLSDRCHDDLVTTHSPPAELAEPYRDTGSLAPSRSSPLIERAGRAGGLVAGFALVLAVTGAIELLKAHVPVLSLSVLYLLAVLPVAVVWGLGLSLVASVLSMLAFNFFFLPPLYTLTLADSRNWFALTAFVVTSVVVSELAAAQRRRARESALLAEIATSLLERGDVTAQLDRIGAESARALQVERATITLGDEEAAGDERYPLAVGDRRVGTIALAGPRPGSAPVRRRLLPALGSLLAVAVDRERLQREAVDAEALRRSDALKTAMLRAVSHDLRTPLMAILTSASALSRQDLALARSDRDELLGTIRTEAERLDRLVRDLLDLSRLQAGAVQALPVPWTVDDLVVQALGELGEDARRVEVGLPERPPIVSVDAQQAERALVNLIENALKYSPQAEPVRVQVSAHGDTGIVRIVDHGPGIEPDELEQIFEPFHRGRTAGKVRGAGLGLAIARGFAEASGGRVWAESRGGQGATFVLELPLAPDGCG
jgi:two-component system sensor histidine kinase KdpD